jgi:DNA-binding MarR family transcriptional regulator
LSKLTSPTARRHSRTTGAFRSTGESQSRVGAPGTVDMSYLEGAIGYAIRRAQIAIFEDIFRAFGEHKVTTAQFSVLAVVADNPGINQADLALALGVERPRMVPIINELQKNGLATRVVDDQDGRTRRIHLTRSGRKLLETLKARFAEHQRRMLKRLGADSPERILSDLRKLASR